MPEDLFVVPSPREDGYVELARVASGKLFRKQILRDGQVFVHPKDKKFKIQITPTLQQSLVDNFHAGYCDTVQFPATDDANAHTESVFNNLGEVIDVEYEPGRGTFATIDARKHADDVGKTILGASAFFSLDYEDTGTGRRVGPTLLHVAATNRPYLTNLEPYQEIAASYEGDSDVVLLDGEVAAGDPDDPTSGVDPSGNANPDSGADTSSEVLNEEDREMELDELIAEMQKHGVDVPALQASAAELKTVQTQLEGGGVQLSATDGTEITPVDLAEAVIELSNTVKEQGGIVSGLREENSRLIRERVEGEVDGLVKVGKVLPKQRDTMVELALSNRATFDALVPDNPIVSLSEDGVTVFEEPEKVKAHEGEVERYVALAANDGAARRKSRRGE